jgi:hypothetical protein
MTTLSDCRGSGWKGTVELWLDPLDHVVRSECTTVVGSGEAMGSAALHGKFGQIELVAFA